VSVAAALIEQGGRVLLVRRPGGRLLGGMWEVPQTSLTGRGRTGLVRELRERHGLRIAVGARACAVRHAITHRRIVAEGYRCTLREPPPASEAHRWVTSAEALDLPMSSLSKKLLRHMEA
jgi:adenine-specific DNA glycosylase